MDAEEERDYAWAAAQEAWLDGNLPEAYHYCHAALARGCDPTAVNALMASIAILLGRYEQARDYLAVASEHAPSQRLGPRYLVIQPWGCSFWGEVQHALGQLAFAEIEGRTPIVWWGKGSLYHASGHENAWDAYFKPINSRLIGEAERPGLAYAPPGWSRESLRVSAASRDVPPASRISSLLFLGDDADVVVADCFTRIQEVLPWAPPGHWLRGLSAEAAIRALLRRYIHPTDAIAGEVDRLERELFTRRPIIAVHVRAQSRMKMSESSEKRALALEDYFPLVDEFIGRNPAGGIYLLTDLKLAVAAFVERYPGIVLVLPAARLDQTEIGAVADVAIDLANDPEALAREVMRDVYLALRAEAFIGDGASAVSCFIRHLKDWPAGTCRLLREDVLLIPGLAKFDRKKPDAADAS